MANWIQRVSEPKKLFLAWQASDHLSERFRWAVGELEATEGVWTLRYFEDGAEFERVNQGRPFSEALALGYQGYPAFPLKRRFHESGVAEAFMRRLPPRNRPDFQEYTQQFRLAPELELSDFSLLGQTEAKLPSDGFSVVDPLDPDADQCDLMLEVAGYRYYNQMHTTKIGQRVEVAPEPDNAKDPNAVQFCVDGRKIGNVNRLQALTFLRWLSKRRVSGVIERLNGKAGRPRAFVFVRICSKNISAAA